MSGSSTKPLRDPMMRGEIAAQPGRPDAAEQNPGPAVRRPIRVLDCAALNAGDEESR